MGRIAMVDGIRCHCGWRLLARAGPARFWRVEGDQGRNLSLCKCVRRGGLQWTSVVRFW